MSTPGVCKGCGASILWVKLNGRWHPAEIRRYTIISEGKLVSGHESHYATCPNAEDFRGKSREVPS